MQPLHVQPLHVQPRYESDVQQFFLWYRDNSEPGICGYTREPNCTFVPLPKLQELFLDHERTTRLLQCIFGSDGRSPVDATNLTGGYERIFAILLLIGRGPYIEHFIQRGIDDLRLPFDALPNDIPVPARDPDFFPAFYRCQWQFCAHVFEQSYNRSKLRNETVLPITSIRDIRSGPNVDVVSIVIHPAYNKLGSDVAGPARNDTYVLKRYCTAEAERYFESELDAYRAVHLGGSGESNLVGFYGTFEQHAAYNVLLEFADQGSLLDYFQTAPPVRSDDIQMFWRNFLDLIKTLDSIHKLQPGHAPGPRVLQGSHGYIKPANILVMNGGSDSKFDVRFKLDVGIEHFIHTTTSRDGGPTSRAYEAPECFLDNVRDFAESPHPEGDIWSLGCILSDSVSWVIRGLDGLEEYRVRRKAELQRLGVLTDEYSFHDGETRLQCVDEWHTELFDFKRPTDRFAEPMTQMLTDMLGEFDERPTAKQLLAKSRRLLFAAGSGGMPQLGGRLPRSLTTASGTGSTTSSHTQRDPHGPTTPPESLFSITTSRSVPISRRPVPQAQYREQSPPLMLSGPQQTFYDSTADEQDGMLIASPLSYTKSGSSRGMSASTAPSSPASPPPAIRRTPDSLAPHDVLSGMQNVRISSLGSALEPTRKQSTRSGVNIMSGAEGHDQRSGVTTLGGGERHDQPSPLEAVEGSPRPSSSLMRIESTTLPPDYRSSVSAASEGLMHRPAGNGAPESNAEQAEVAVSPLILPAQGISRRNPKAAPFLSVPRLHTWRQDMREKSSSITIDTRERIHLLPADKRDHVFLIDDASSMQAHWLDVTFLFSDFSYLIKNLPGPEGMSLGFSISLERKKSKATSDFLKALEKRSKVMETAGPSTSNMESRLSAILGEYISSLENEKAPPGRVKHSPFVKKPAPVRPLSLHVYTDGIWQPRCEAENPIREADKKLEELHLPKTQIAINFVQFGQDESATRRLQRIEKQFKIVDVEPFKDGNVWKMLNGAIDKDYKEPQHLPAAAAATSGSLSGVSELVGSPVQESGRMLSRNQSYR